MNVRPISNEDAKPWVMESHYAKRLPNIVYAFGLIVDDGTVGIVTYGTPPSPTVGRSIFADNGASVLELNRLIVSPKAPKNAASFLVGRSLRLLKSSKYDAVVSYADTAMHHVGYVYQSTNFLYLGAASAHEKEYLVNGKWTHARSLVTIGITAPTAWALANNIETRKTSEKHKYVYPLRPCVRQKILPAILPYPKGNTERYATSDPKPQPKQETFLA